MKNYENPILRDIEPGDFLVSDPHRILNNNNYSDDISDEQRTKNSIAWIDSLDPEEGFQKTTQQLGVKINGSDWENVSDHRKEGKYCCLGVACVGLGILNRTSGTSVFPHAYDDRLTDLLGFAKDNGYFTERIPLPQDGLEVIPNFVETIMELNDRVYGKDKNFKHVRRFILDNLDRIFLPEVSEGIKKHHGIKG